MTQCPICNARIKTETVCYRCKTDLSLLLKIEAAAALVLDQAKIAILNSEYDQAMRLLQQSRHLHNTPTAESLALLIKALRGDFQPVLERLIKSLI